MNRLYLIISALAILSSSSFLAFAQEAPVSDRALKLTEDQSKKADPYWTSLLPGDLVNRRKLSLYRSEKIREERRYWGANSLSAGLQEQEENEENTAEVSSSMKGFQQDRGVHWVTSRFEKKRWVQTLKLPFLVAYGAYRAYRGDAFRFDLNSDASMQAHADVRNRRSEVGLEMRSSKTRLDLAYDYGVSPAAWTLGVSGMAEIIQSRTGVRWAPDSQWMSLYLSRDMSEHWVCGVEQGISYRTSGAGTPGSNVSCGYSWQM